MEKGAPLPSSAASATKTAGNGRLSRSLLQLPPVGPCCCGLNLCHALHSVPQRVTPSPACKWPRSPDMVGHPHAHLLRTPRHHTVAVINPLVGDVSLATVAGPPQSAQLPSRRSHTALGAPEVPSPKGSPLCHTLPSPTASTANAATSHACW